ncbi:hypothetical protein DAPPUDRAFT_233682 [Daphnia pulex]|uniref:Uncharacterized protein n=1 Tax=Daphnia pulex TaxID=6669 RepID=E9FVF8_DAPPU|nr:hypothetical protein DAPPUDRAFT_233682 [Daphnia pulex]|eukprot:EFX88547.1 hypothetical protein DAPPUDRAFT_233682 [Daphnia pulex]
MEVEAHHVPLTHFARRLCNRIVGYIGGRCNINSNSLNSRSTLSDDVSGLDMRLNFSGKCEAVDASPKLYDDAAAPALKVVLSISRWPIPNVCRALENWAVEAYNSETANTFSVYMIKRIEPHPAVALSPSNIYNTAAAHTARLEAVSMYLRIISKHSGALAYVLHIKKEEGHCCPRSSLLGEGLIAFISQSTRLSTVAPIVFARWRPSHQQVFFINTPIDRVASV